MREIRISFENVDRKDLFQGRFQVSMECGEFLIKLVVSFALYIRVFYRRFFIFSFHIFKYILEN